MLQFEKCIAVRKKQIVECIVVNGLSDVCLVVLIKIIKRVVDNEMRTSQRKSNSNGY